MTDPKQKAIELVEKFRFVEIANYSSIFEVKQCALICCQEIIDLIECFSESEQTIEFYESVKEEITKM